MISALQNLNKKNRVEPYDPNLYSSTATAKIIIPIIIPSQNTRSTNTLKKLTLQRWTDPIIVLKVLVDQVRGTPYFTCTKPDQALEPPTAKPKSSRQTKPLLTKAQPSFCLRESRSDFYHKRLELHTS